MQSHELRTRFFDYFVSKGHTVVPSSSLIPAQDPTLLFANAGMNQFKDVFLGKEKRSYSRAVSIQKCIRAGGKHNDLDQVGFTSRHLTFFEMMGNFSFGDYFKHDAITYAWEFLTKEIGLPADKLYASVFEKDDEAYEIWKNVVGLPASRIVRLGAADNFWQMGDTGPCGPCTEIYIDRGQSIGCKQQNCAPGCSCDRFLEIWNNVFMQFDRQPDGTDVPLARTGVDTGMGLERLCAVVQGVDSVFNTDLFSPIFKAIERETGVQYTKTTPELQKVFHVVSDHIRSTAGAIADGGLPGNEGRGYVIRKIIRRATLFAQKLNCPDLLVRLIPDYVASMERWYPELRQQSELITRVMRAEVDKFAHNVVQGKALVLDLLPQAKNQILSGAHAFKLYDTYGFPLELTEIIAHEHGYTVDRAGFEVEMEKQRQQSSKREAEQLGVTSTSVQTMFTGYDELSTTSVIRQLIAGDSVDAIAAGTPCWIIPEKSPFYVECGGQISDEGTVTVHGKTVAITGLKKIDKAIAIQCVAPVNLTVGDAITQQVYAEKRTATMKNHTATHLLQAALMSVLGPQVKQSGSLVAPDYLRFDFTYPQALTPDEIALVELLVNKAVLANTPLRVSQTTYQDAVGRGVIAFFGEKYNPDAVRVVEVPGVSAELCGGTHVRATGDIGLFKITEVTSLSAGNRRLVAVTGLGALALCQESYGIVQELGRTFKVKPGQLLSAVGRQSDHLKDAQQQLKKAKKQLLQSQAPNWVAEATQIAVIPYKLVTITDGTADELKELVQFMLAAKPGCYIATTQAEGKLLYMGAVAPQYGARVDMRELGAKLKAAGFPGGSSAITVQGGSQQGNAAQLDKLVSAWLAERSGMVFKEYIG